MVKPILFYHFFYLLISIKTSYYYLSLIKKDKKYICFIVYCLFINKKISTLINIYMQIYQPINKI